MTKANFPVYRNGERSKSSSLSEPSGGGGHGLAEEQELLLVNGDMKPSVIKTPLVSINSLAAEREGAVSPRTYSLVQ